MHAVPSILWLNADGCVFMHVRHSNHGMLKEALRGRARTHACVPTRAPFLCLLSSSRRSKKFVAVLKEKFADYNLTYSIGGQISFDVFPQVGMGNLLIGSGCGLLVSNS
jgi:hypothetical protein